MSDDYVVVLSTLPAGGDAASIARKLVDERLAACVNILPVMTSIYRWAGAIEDASERQLVMKTARAQIAALRDRLRELHPYDVPEFIVLPVIDGSDAYLDWIRDSVGGRAT